MAIVPNERAAPARTQSTGMNHRLDLRWMSSLRSLIELRDYPLKAMPNLTRTHGGFS